MLKEHALKKDLTWSPSCFIIDDAPQERHAIKYNKQFIYLVPFYFVHFCFQRFFFKMFLKYFHVVMGVVVFSF
jgi:hypothetical protein